MLTNRTERHSALRCKPLTKTFWDAVLISLTLWALLCELWFFTNRSGGSNVVVSIVNVLAQQD